MRRSFFMDARKVLGFFIGLTLVFGVDALIGKEENQREDEQGKNGGTDQPPDDHPGQWA